MGRCTCPPVVKLNPSVAVSPKLLWFPVTKKGRNAGEVLLAAELLLKDKVKKTLKNFNCTATWVYDITLRRWCFALQVNEGDLPLVPPRRGENLYMVPQGIRPVVQLTAIEVHHQLIQFICASHYKFPSHTWHDQTRPAQPFLLHFSSVTPFLPLTYPLPS